MRLKRVRVFGFKTFADRTEVNLDGGVVAVVGPNGCGKSNLVDAILWGLGEGNSRQLRAQTGQDVIFNGSGKRKPVGFAEVTLLFDNEDRALPVDASEVTIRRRLTRSGESEYQINGQNVRQRDVYELLADSGLGRSGYAIVGQKEIDAALSASADDRRGWIDEAAGVQRYRTRKNESQRRLNQAAEHLQRVDDILRELESQREPLRDEAEQARKYRSVQTALREVEIGLLVRDTLAAVRELEELEKSIEAKLKLAGEEGVRAESLEVQMRRIGAEVSEIETEMDSVRGLQQASLTAKERAESALKLAQQRLETLDAQERDLESDREAAEARLQEASTELEGLEEQAQSSSVWLDELRVSLGGAGEEAKALAKALGDAERALDLARAQHARMVKAQADSLSRGERLTQIERELKGLLESFPEIEEAIAAAFSEESAVREATQAEQEAVKAAEAELVSIRQEEDRDAQTVRQALAERASLEGRKRGIEATLDSHEGLSQGARAVMEASERGLLQAEYVPVGEAIEADKEFALAIETALGASANDLIVDEDRHAKEAIEWLKSHRAGRATFQPIPLMRPAEASFELKRVLGERGVLGRASELVSTKNRFRPVIDSLLGRVVIVEQLDDALRLARTTGWSRMVTLDGEVVHSSGAVTGGQQSRQGYGMVQRKADLLEIEDHLVELTKTVEQYESRSAKRRQRTVQTNEKLTELRSGAQAKLNELNEAVSFHRRLQEEQKGAIRERERLEREIQSLSKQQVEIEQVDLEHFERLRDEALKQVAAKNADAGQAEQRLRDAEDAVRQNYQRLDAGRKRLQAAQEAEEARQRRARNLEPEREKARGESAQAVLAIEAALKDRAEADSRLEALQVTRREKLEASLQLAEEAKNARENARAISEAAHQAELGRTRADSRRAAALQRLYEEYGMTEEDAVEQEGQHEVPDDAPTVVAKLRRELRSMGDVNLGAIEAYERLTGRLEELGAQRDDVVQGIQEIEGAIRELDRLTRDKFLTTFSEVQAAFATWFTKLFGGGEGSIQLTLPDSVLDSGVEIEVTLPGKKRQALNLLSGGERALCTAAFLFALLQVKPSPLVVLDEVDAPLDGRNVERFSEALHAFTDTTQFIVITHNHTTIVSANVFLGVTMKPEDPGVSTLVPVKMPTQGGSPGEPDTLLA